MTSRTRETKFPVFGVFFVVAVYFSVIENEIFIKDCPAIKMFVGGLSREDSLLSSTAFMQDSVQFPSVGCLWHKTRNHLIISETSTFHRIWLQ